ncbi:MAG: glutathione S-transferase N-terminal domain-containing protein [DPANN group archaeon]|nr:glutathione S-transferase N-terminal domain-containing protein [DPANN group archaeon]
MTTAILYTTPTCVYCGLVKEFFKEHKIKFKEIDVTKDSEAADDMVKKSGGFSVPVIDIGGQIVVGFDKTKLKKLLKINSSVA